MADDALALVTDAEWAETMADAEHLVDAYGELGFSVTLLEPRTVMIRDERGPVGHGFEITVDAETLSPIHEQVAEAGLEFDATEVYSAVGDSVTILVLVLLAREEGVALVVPLAYAEAGAAMLDAAADAGGLRTVLHDPDGRTVVFAHDDPTVFRAAGS